ncbi:hypothetical protein, partial [Escherichia coli]
MRRKRLLKRLQLIRKRQQRKL